MNATYLSRAAMHCRLQYFNCCVSWNTSDVHAHGGLCDMIREASDITRKTFLKHVDRESLRSVEAQLSYSRHPSQGLTMAGDFHVSYHRSKLHGATVYFFSYHRSKLHGATVYFFRHSAIEYVFAEEGGGA